MAKDEAALEAKCISEVADELGGNRDQSEVTLNQVGRLAKLINNVLEPKLVVDKAARSVAHP